MSDDRIVRPPNIRKIQEGTSFHSLTDWIVAFLIMGAAVATIVYPVWYLDIRFVFDPYAPDFNPAVFLPVFLFAFGLKYLISAVRGTMLGRRFGKSVMEMEGETVAPGETLRGVVRVPADLVPLGDYEVRLQCVHQIRSSSKSTNLKDYIRGEQTLRVKAQTVNPKEGIPFAFTIPTDAMTTQLPDVMMEGSVRWILEVKAPVSGLDFYSIFGVEVRASRRPQANPSRPPPLSLDLFDARLRKLGTAKLGLDLGSLTPADGIATMVEFYRAERAEGYEGVGRDLLRFSWGTHEEEGAEHFQLSIARLFSLDPNNGEADLWELTLAFRYSPEASFQALGKGYDKCWGLDDIKRFEKSIRRSKAMKAVGGVAAKTVSLRYHV